MDLYTIGHSNHPADEFIRLLTGQGIRLIVDVRSTPYSRFNPHFNKDNLKRILLEQHIEYAYAGASLGGRPCDPSCYIHNAIPAKGADYLHEVNYPEVMQRPWFIEGIQQLLDLAGKQRTTIMCSEEDPAMCHRHHLIARYLMSTYPEVTILHIRRDGSLVNARSIPALMDKPDAEQLSF